MKTKTKTKKKSTKEVCIFCEKRKAKKLHTCPFQVEINDNNRTLCNCCDECTHQCQDDI